MARNPFFFVARDKATSARLNNDAKGWYPASINSGDQSLGTVSATTYAVSSSSTTNTYEANRLLLLMGQATIIVGGSGSVVVSLDILEGSTNLGRAEVATVATGATKTLGGWATSVIAAAGDKTHSLQITVLSVVSGSPTISVSGTNPSQAKVLPLDMGDAG